jgi:hypothetical protein
VSSVVRTSHKGESHGGVFLVDLATDSTERVLDWNDPSIDWEGRGGDRGLRGIAFHGERVLLAASDEIFIYDRRFRLLSSISNPYLKHCHEIFADRNRLFMTSTGFDSVLEYDLAEGRFVRGYCLRFGPLWRLRRVRKHVAFQPRPRFTTFDPAGPDGPAAADTCHINNVFHSDGTLYISGSGLRGIWAVRDGLLRRYARIPYGSHNARPFRGGVILNHTATDRLAVMTRQGRPISSFELVHYGKEQLQFADLPQDLARQAFGRGLAVVSDDLVVGGSSPATVTVYGMDPPHVIKSLNVTLDVRNAIHGLEVWPFD